MSTESAWRKRIGCVECVCYMPVRFWFEDWPLWQMSCGYLGLFKRGVEQCYERCHELFLPSFCLSLYSHRLMRPTTSFPAVWLLVADSFMAYRPVARSVPTHDNTDTIKGMHPAPTRTSNPRSQPPSGARRTLKPNVQCYRHFLLLGCDNNHVYFWCDVNAWDRKGPVEWKWT